MVTSVAERGVGAMSLAGVIHNDDATNGRVQERRAAAKTVCLVRSKTSEQTPFVELPYHDTVRGR